MFKVRASMRGLLFFLGLWFRAVWAAAWIFKVRVSRYRLLLFGFGV